MVTVIKCILGIFFLALSLLLNPLAVHAQTPPPGLSQQQFSTSYDVTYDVGDDGITTVTEKIVLKNLTSQFYANQFKLTIGATQVSDVKAFDDSGPMEVQSNTKDNSTTIQVKFNQQVAGLGKQLPWTLSFKSKDFAEHQGKVWEIRVPKISSGSNLENYNLTLSVPSSFGDPTLVSPTPKSQTTNYGKIFLTFDKDQLKDAGVSASFGSNQIFDFDLTYHLQNKDLVPILTNIALPPDTAYQDIIFQRMDPKPINVTVDDDGNYLAWYRLTRNQKLDVKVIGSAKLYTNSKVKNPNLPVDLQKKYLQPQKYWETDNPMIKTKAAEILADSSSVSSVEKARLIYRYVVNTLKYDPTRLSNNIDRLGAVTALNNPQTAVCMEFTDTFIALARASGVPAREVNGFAYSSNTTLRPLSLTKDVLHSWPEYWDDARGWVMVDPTWENTTGGVDYFNKLDLNHFAFVVKGLSSERPVPAGSYKYDGQDSHDVKVALSNTDFLGKPQIDVAIDNPNPLWAGLPAKFTVKVTNFGNALYLSNQFNISSQNLVITPSNTSNLGPIPAFGSATFEFNVKTRSLFDTFNDTFTVLIADQKFTKDIAVKPFILFQNFPVAIGLILLFTLGIYLAVWLGLFLRKKRIAAMKK